MRFFKNTKYLHFPVKRNWKIIYAIKLCVDVNIDGVSLMVDLISNKKINDYS